MTVLLAGISGDSQYVKSHRTFYELEVGKGDEKKEWPSGRGDVSRRLAGDYFMDSTHSHILMLDVDMMHPPTLLRQLQENIEVMGMVSGHYYARNSRNVHSIWCKVGDGKWPYPPYIDPPRSGYVQIGMTGMGNVLISKTIYKAVLDYLPDGDEAFAIGPAPEITGNYRSLGTDFRFFSIAQLLGYTLWGNADVESKHATVFWLGRDLADKLQDDKKIGERLEEYSKQFILETGMDAKALELRVESLKKKRDDMQQQKDSAIKTVDFATRQIQVINGIISDEMWIIEQMKKDEQTSPEVKTESNQLAFPETDDRESAMANRTRIAGVTNQEAKLARENVLKVEAEGFVEDANILNRAG